MEEGKEKEEEQEQEQEKMRALRGMHPGSRRHVEGSGGDVESVRFLFFSFPPILAVIFVALAAAAALVVAVIVLWVVAEAHPSPPS